MMEILLVRHGQTDWNVERKVMGRQPIPLNTNGRAQARLLAKALKDIPIDAIYSSPVKRAIQTAKPVLKGRETVPLFEEPGFAEIDYGEWINRKFVDIPELAEFFRNPAKTPIPGGETLEEVKARSVGAIEAIRNKHSSGRVMAISHADVIKIIITHYLGMPMNDIQRFRIDNCSVTALHFGDIKDPRFVSVNAMGDFKRYCHL